MPFEESLILYAAETFANLRMANLFNFRFSCQEEEEQTLLKFQRLLHPKGISIELVQNCKGFSLVYVYREALLEKRLQEEKTRSFLEAYGYPENGEVHESLGVLKERLMQNAGFPHEIGVFLGYPLFDVISFIEKQGKDFCYSGEWKVYGNAEEAKQLFLKFRKCKEAYRRAYQRGSRVSDLLLCS